MNASLKNSALNNDKFNNDTHIQLIVVGIVPIPDFWCLLNNKRVQLGNKLVILLTSMNTTLKNSALSNDKFNNDTQIQLIVVGTVPIPVFWCLLNNKWVQLGKKLVILSPDSIAYSSISLGDI